MTFPIVAPVAGLPPGPATEATVKTNLSLDLTDDRDDAQLQLTIDAANTLVADLRIVQELPADLEEWPFPIVLAATLLASRWFRRSNSPAGVIDLGGDAGVAYVQRNDPDIAQMLRLGPHMRPAVG